MTFAPTTHDRARPSRRARPTRRGVAMLLVLVAVSVGVVLAGVVLATRESGPRIGRNAEASSQAAWSARAAAGYAEAVLRSGEAWADKAAADGTVMNAFALAGGTVRVTLTDPQGNPPDAGDRELILTAISSVNGIEVAETRRISRVRPAPSDAIIDPYLGEFALFAGTRLTIEDDAQIMVCPTSAEQGTLIPVKIGTGFASSADLTIGGEPDLRGAAFYPDATASAALQAFTGCEDFAGGEVMPVDIPAIAERLPAEFASLPIINLLSITANTSGAVTTLTAGEHAGIRVQNNHTVVLGGAAGTPYRYKINQIQIGVNGILRVEGQVMVHVPSTLQFSGGGALVFADASSSIAFYTGSTVLVDNAGVGVDVATSRNAARDPSEIASFPDSRRVRFIALNTASGGAANPGVTIRNNSIVVGMIHSPGATLEIRDASTLVGRATAGEVCLRGGARLWYDPVLDSRVGFTALDGPLYSGGTLTPELAAALSSVNLDDGASLVTETLNTAVKSSSTLTLCTVDDDDDDDGLLGLGGTLGLVEEPPPEAVEPEPAPENVSVRPAGRTKSRRLPVRADAMEDD